MHPRKRQSFSSKREGWEIKKLRCATCMRWIKDGEWDNYPFDVVLFCSDDCSLLYINAEEEDIVY
jgi:hypothetical protein